MFSPNVKMKCVSFPLQFVMASNSKQRKILSYFNSEASTSKTNEEISSQVVLVSENIESDEENSVQRAESTTNGESQSSRKRKRSTVNKETQTRNYQTSWEYDYFISLINRGSEKIQRCLLCWDLPQIQQPVLGKSFNVKNHYNNKHAKKLEEDGIGIDQCSKSETAKHLRLFKIKDLLKKAQQQTSLLQSSLQPSQQSYAASIKCAELVAVKTKAFKDGVFGFEVGLNILESILPNVPGLTDKHKENIISSYSNVAISRPTITRRTEVSNEN